MRRNAFGFLALLAIAGCNSAPQDTVSKEPAAGTSASPAGAAVSDPAEAARGFVRALHVVPGAGAVSLKVDDQTLATGVTYGNASGFAGVANEKIKVYAIGSDGKNLAGPMPVDLDKGEDLTVVVNGVPGDVALLPYKHHNRGAEKGKAKVAFMHAAKALPAVEVRIDGERYRGDVDYGEDTDYRVLTPGRHEMQVIYEKSLPVTPAPTPIPVPGATVIPGATPAAPKERISLTQQLDLVAGKVYSVVVFHDSARLPKLRLLEDKFVPTLTRAPDGAAPKTAVPPAP
ncbi:MAG TPA: DUF4397 domain-containing protein [Abditibacteriaceae bacterium]